MVLQLTMRKKDMRGHDAIDSSEKRVNCAQYNMFHASKLPQNHNNSYRFHAEAHFDDSISSQYIARRDEDITSLVCV